MSAFTGNYAAEASVFWDIDQCEIPEELKACETVQRIRESLTRMGHRGRVTINAYGDKKHHDFNSTGVEFNQFASGRKHERHTKILEDIVSFASQNPQPSTVMLILGDVSDDFVEVVRLLTDQRNYKFLYVHPPERPTPTVVILMAPPAGGN